MEKGKDEAGLDDIDDLQFPEDVHNHFMRSWNETNRLREGSSDGISNEKAAVN